MKLAFSTLGCPNFSWVEIYSMAKDLGFKKVLKSTGLGDEISAVRAQPFSEEQLPHTLKKPELRLEIPCLTTGCYLKFARRCRKEPC